MPDLNLSEALGGSRLHGMRVALSAAAAVAMLTTAVLAGQSVRDASPQFEFVQPDLFSGFGGQPNAWADFDADGRSDTAAADLDAVTCA